MRSPLNETALNCAIEASLLGLFMVSACLSVIAMEHPRSAVQRRIRRPYLRRAVVGLLMGLTAVALIYSPLGQHSGAHMNPAVTLAFYSLGKLSPLDCIAYITAQFIGGASGVLILLPLLRRHLADPTVNFVATLPGACGRGVAWIAEFAMSMLLMLVVLLVSNHPPTMRLAGLFAGGLVAAFIAFEAPLSGMSINPARSFASACFTRDWRAFWIYFTAPPLGMLAAAALFTATSGHCLCAKLAHPESGPCHFHCQVQKSAPPTPAGLGDIR